MCVFQRFRAHSGVFQAQGVTDGVVAFVSFLVAHMLQKTVGPSSMLPAQRDSTFGIIFSYGAGCRLDIGW